MDMDWDRTSVRRSMNRVSGITRDGTRCVGLTRGIGDTHFLSVVPSNGNEEFPPVNVLVRTEWDSVLAAIAELGEEAAVV